MSNSGYDEMVQSLNLLIKEAGAQSRNYLVFGYCEMTLRLIDLLERKGIQPIGILDNSTVKQKEEYKGIHVYYPEKIVEFIKSNKQTEVLIVSRFYETMAAQLRRLGFLGTIRKMINYNTYADYSLSYQTICAMRDREKKGEKYVAQLQTRYPNAFRVFFPFNALGDVYLGMSYWPAFALKAKIRDVVFCVASRTLADVINMFGNYKVEVYSNKDLDAMIQAEIYAQDRESFIVHQDRPYVINLSKALCIKKITFDQIYCCGIYGLKGDTVPVIPTVNYKNYKYLESIPEGKAVIFSPYAKSVISLPVVIWKEAVESYKKRGYKCYTNVVGDEKPLDGTIPISANILEIKSIVERAGIFIGIRSGLCDVLREANAKKIVLYPDYYYCDTQWKAIDIYWIKQFEYNLQAQEGIKWEKL